ncbi:MAG TPA: hypothetical protein VF551_09465, partial [Chthoniobacterales bacterium]
MMRAAFVPVLLAFCVVARVGAADLSKLSGPELIARLNEPRTRVAAFAELYQRTEPEGEFKRVHRQVNPELIVCPQPAGPPIYLVLTQYAYEPAAEDGFKIDNPLELFPRTDESARVPPPPDAWRAERTIFAYSAEGERLTPFGGWNALDGYIFDMNGDGFVERIETQNYGTDRPDETIEFLRVHRVERKSVSLLSVAINRARGREFGWTISREPGGRYAVLIGPKANASSNPAQEPVLKTVAATFRWNEERGRYDGPRGSIEEHFILVDPDDDFGPAMKMIRAAPPFPPQPVIANASPPPSPTPAPTPAEKWRYSSLRG